MWQSDEWNDVVGKWFICSIQQSRLDDTDSNVSSCTSLWVFGVENAFLSLYIISRDLVCAS